MGGGYPLVVGMSVTLDGIRTLTISVSLGSSGQTQSRFLRLSRPHQCGENREEKAGYRNEQRNGQAGNGNSRIRKTMIGGEEGDIRWMDGLQETMEEREGGGRSRIEAKSRRRSEVQEVTRNPIRIRKSRGSRDGGHVAHRFTGISILHPIYSFSSLSLCSLSCRSGDPGFSATMSKPQRLRMPYTP
ncbi:hypothetical protein BDW42DRAFT_165668 [Aspergillus taichungensis]|uniref:Uncharacterized protein n=1 Tax=Aspergillus taichungensis TaxID=482145 RepID=A0A2J5HZV2_9EURO|nr:hypothetical protein BDW42DRAFT_165668 [Aspergillus taichungensis]